MYYPKISPNFVKLSSCTVPILACTVRKLFCMVVSQFQLVRTRNSTYIVKKIIMYCPKISPDFVESASFTVPILTCTVQKLTFISRKTCLDLDLISNSSFCNNDLVLPLNFNLSCPKKNFNQEINGSEMSQ